MRNNILISHYSAPCGELILGSYENKLCLCNWMVSKHPGRVDKRLQTLLRADYEKASSDIVREAARQLDEYFRHERTVFDLPLLLAGTDFQKQVWEELLHVPYGHTVSYCEIAARVNRPTAFRAVANANGANAISIIVPCHRVVGYDHSPVGYGGGIEAKKFLLEWEKMKVNKNKNGYGK